MSSNEKNCIITLQKSIEHKGCSTIHQMPLYLTKPDITDKTQTSIKKYFVKILNRSQHIMDVI